MSQICYVIVNQAWPEWVKIGMTTKSEMKTRLSTYQTGSPFRDYVVYHEVYFEDARTAEKEISKRLVQMNATRGEGEWYKMTPRLAANMLDSIFDDMDNGLL